jgi:dTDP-4-dehydrorhamnose reductase
MARVREVRPEVIFYAAGFADVDGCEVDRWRAYLSNRDGAEHLSRAAGEVGALVVYPSSDLIFDGARLIPYREEDPPNPLSVYGDTKLAAELAVMSHAPRHLILRTGWLFGPFGRSMVNDILDARRTEEVIFAFDDHRSQPTHQADFVDAVLALVRQGQTGVWHVAGEGDATAYDVARATYEILKVRSVEVKPLRRGAGQRAALRPRYSVLDGSKLRAAGVRMRNWKDALREFLLQHASV